MAFSDEASFEEALIKALVQNGWESEVIKYPTESDLIQNWAEILFENNRGIDRLNDCPLTDGEIQQIMEQIKTLRTPLKLNGFINGKTVAITRDNPKDTLHLGKEVSLKIYDRKEIAAGQSRYQIVEQPLFARREKVLNDRRGDLMLLINGMPVFHLELKKSGIDISQAYNQISKYAHEGIFTGLFSLIQVFVAMTPEETLYFANPGPDGQFNKDYYFHWADFNNEPVNDWKQIASTLLSIPMAHQLIGFYTVADDADGVLKVMRSYQYYAANRISDCVAKTDWTSGKQLGGYVWHTTGSGKTMTSFKSAQLIATSKDADKVIFLMDRIELGTQSLKEYRAFADDADSVQETEDTVMLITKLKSIDPKDTLIVTSIQKMSNIKDDAQGLRSADIEVMSEKRIVFIVDEAHRSTFGDMLLTIKHTFPNAIFFGFTGTPIQEENQKKMNTTATVFGNELHRYSIADGIRDKNVLGFDPYMVLTYRDKDIRKEVALMMAKAKTEDEALADPKKSQVFYEYMDSAKIPMAGDYGADGKYVKGIEDYLSRVQYERIEHQEAVVKDMMENWPMLSHNGKFHAILATSSIPEAVEYYRLMKAKKPEWKVTALFDPTIDNDGGGALKKEDGIAEMLQDYNAAFQQNFDMAGYAKFKKDVSARLAHKKPYERISQDQQLDILIVVNQMLTGFDSKWINTLYLDKVMEYENIIQAFSRTNRLFGPDKPFGTIRYYRMPHTMKRNIERAVKLYSGDRVLGLFVDHLGQNLNKMNAIFEEIDMLFRNAGIDYFEKLPDELPVRGKFAKLFKQFNEYKEAASIQGFEWGKMQYSIEEEGKSEIIELHFDETIYLTLVQRYKELFTREPGNKSTEEVPFEIESYLIEIDTGKIDSDYMNSRFEKYLKMLEQKDVDSDILQNTLDELHKSFASLSQEEQKYANLFLHDVQSGDAKLRPNMKFRDYIVEYQMANKNDQIHRMAAYFGLSEPLLREMMERNITEANINEYGRLKNLRESVNKADAKVYFEALEGKKLSPPKVNIYVDKFLRKFILEGGFDIPDPFIGTNQKNNQEE